MSQVYTFDNTNNPTTAQIPDDGDDLDVASILAICEASADKAAYAVEGNTSFSGRKTFSATGQWVRRVENGSSSATHTYDVPTSEHIRVPAAPGISLSYTLKSTSPAPVEGSVLYFKRIPNPGASVNVQTVTFLREDVTVLAIMPSSTACWAYFEFLAGEWYLAENYGVV